MVHIRHEVIAQILECLPELLADLMRGGLDGREPGKVAAREEWDRRQAREMGHGRLRVIYALAPQKRSQAVIDAILASFGVLRANRCHSTAEQIFQCAKLSSHRLLCVDQDRTELTGDGGSRAQAAERVVISIRRLLRLALYLEQRALLQVCCEEIGVQSERNLQCLQLRLLVPELAQHHGEVDAKPWIARSTRYSRFDERPRLGRATSAQGQKSAGSQ